MNSRRFMFLPTQESVVPAYFSIQRGCVHLRTLGEGLAKRSFGVNRVVLTVRRSLPVYSQLRIWRCVATTDAMCQTQALVTCSIRVVVGGA
jgi:hypothetical protein